MISQEVRAEATVDSTTYIVGDPIRVSLQLTHPRGTTLTPLVADTVGSFSVLGWDGLRLHDDSTTTGGLVVARYDSGLVMLPSFRIAYRVPGAVSDDTVATNPLRLRIDLVEVDTTQSIKDLKPPLTIPWTVAEIALIVAIAIAVVGGAILCGRLLKRWRKGKPAPIDVAPARPAHIVAFEELAALREKKLWQQGFIKAYYSELTEILRRYFENRFGITALEQTTDEILRDISRHIRDPIRGDIEQALRQADLVKFAKLSPPVSYHDTVMSSAYQIVEHTRVGTSTVEPVPAREIDVAA
jgi:hypothetical protein